MEEKILELIKLADILNNKQDKVYAKIAYTANDIRKVELAIISKENCSYIERCEFNLHDNPLVRLDSFIKLFESYIDDTIN